MSKPRQWSFAVDRGGTFTDIIGLSPRGAIHRLKLLSQSSLYDDASIEGIRRMTGTPPDDPLPEEIIAEIRMGTTVATNALLERRGEPVGLIVTKGFGDLLEIGRQARPRLFDLTIVKPERLYAAVAEVDERIGPDGAVDRPLDESALTGALRRLRDDGLTGVAILFLHAWIDPRHERRAGELARAAGFSQVSLSHACVRRIGAVERGETALIDAYLSPILARYVDRVKRATGSIPLHFMQSSGGLSRAERFGGKDAILSGPAGGVVAIARLRDRLRLPSAVGFDMGGTSTDVCRYGGAFERSFTAAVAGVSFAANMLHVETVAAGGGSILGFDGRRMTVGPASAGADPGPTCYGKGGPLTVTDANLILGRLDPESFPTISGPDENEPLHVEATRGAFERRASEIAAATGTPMTVEAAALGYLRIADEIMARPIKAISLARGYDLRESALVAFGGAGGMHACSLARTLGVGTVVVHPLAGLYSAYGIALADHTVGDEATCLTPLTAAGYAEAGRTADRLTAAAIERLRVDGFDADRATTTVAFDLRPQGADGFLTVPDRGDRLALASDFADAHVARFGFAPSTEAVEIVNVRIEARIRADGRFADAPVADASSPPPGRSRPIRFADGVFDCPIIGWPASGDTVVGPALIVDPHCTVIVEPGFTATIDETTGSLILTGRGTGFMRATDDRVADPVSLEVFNHAFMSVADQMGQTLVNTAHSVNMKERLDFSCALFDPDGGLVANAPHIPVHLGAMGETVKALIAEKGDDFADGRVYVGNHPAKGGSHLPDITVVTPVYLDPARNRPDFFVATRGHHADIGGATPGSLSPFSATLAEEGIVLDNLLMVDAGGFRKEAVVAALTAGRFPARNIPERLSDLLAQAAANAKGAEEIKRLVGEQGERRVKAYMGHVKENAAHAVRRALGRLLAERDRFESTFTDRMDDGSPIVIRVTVVAGPAPPRTHAITVDFSGSAPPHAGSLNAPFAVVRAAVIYVVRTLVDDDIPLNDGCMAPVTIIVPENSILNPPPDAAVVGGNVETSQRIVDVFLGALGVAAAAQGTMNNLTVGFAGGPGFYETIAGGSGATPEGDGADGVQVHMTNTRITDPEVLERRFPGVRLERFAVRKNSGGKGVHRGGNGLIRRFRFLQPAQVTLLTERRVTAPFGLAGGGPGKPGVNTLTDVDGTESTLPGHAIVTVRPGQRLTVETPGGGGYAVTHAPAAPLR
jgi:5-oxoprolinase (ATP-hydrolysing)